MQLSEHLIALYTLKSDIESQSLICGQQHSLTIRLWPSDCAVVTFRANLTIPSDALPEGYKTIFLAPRGKFVDRLLEILQTGALQCLEVCPWQSQNFSMSLQAEHAYIHKHSSLRVFCSCLGLREEQGQGMIAEYMEQHATNRLYSRPLSRTFQ